MLRRCLLLAAILLLAAAPAGAQKRAPASPAPPTIVWTATDAIKFAAIRRGFPEYAALDDREFAHELLDRVRRVWLADKGRQEEFHQAFVARLPWYDIYSWPGLHNELIRLLLTAYAHFSSRS